MLKWHLLFLLILHSSCGSEAGLRLSTVLALVCISPPMYSSFPEPFGPHISLLSCVAEVCSGHMDADADGLSSPCEAAVCSWRSMDALFGHRQILHPGHLHHSPAACLGHLGLADLQMLHTDTQYIHWTRYTWVGIEVQQIITMLGVLLMHTVWFLL